MINLPNILTFIRFFLIIPFYFLFIKLNFNSTLLSFIIYIIACITDYLDGKIARKFNLTTKIGVFLDPLADKFLVITGFFLFSLKTNISIPIYLIILLIIREIFITLLRIETDFILKPLNLTYDKSLKEKIDQNLKLDTDKSNNYKIENKNEVNLKTSFIAKIKTTIQMITLIYCFIVYLFSFKINIESFFTKTLPLLLFILVLFFAYSSAIDYIKKKKEDSINTIFRLFSSFFYTGYFPKFPGTFSSFIFYFISYFIIKIVLFSKDQNIYNFNQLNNLINNISILISLYFFILLISSFLTILIGNKSNDLYGDDDPKNFTLDEIAGASLSIFFSFILLKLIIKNNFFKIKIENFSINKDQILLFIIISLIFNFVLFRFFDIFKPLGIKKSQKLKKGLGILIDDLIAGIYTFFILFLIILFRFI